MVLRFKGVHVITQFKRHPPQLPPPPYQSQVNPQLSPLIKASLPSLLRKTLHLPLLQHPPPLTLNYTNLILPSLLRIMTILIMTLSWVIQLSSQAIDLRSSLHKAITRINVTKYWRRWKHKSHSQRHCMGRAWGSYSPMAQSSALTANMGCSLSRFVDIYEISMHIMPLI